MTTSASPPTTTTAKPVYFKDALFVALDSSIATDEDPVRFQHVGVDVAEAYDPVAGKFYAMRPGIYWAAISAGAPATNGAVRFQLYRGEDLIGSVDRQSTSANGVDTLSRDIMVSMKQFQTLHMRSYLGNGLYSDTGHQTSLSLFRLSELMKTDIFFSVARQKNADGQTSQIIPFPEVLINEGKAFDVVNHYFKVPQDGIYFFSYSIGAVTATKADVMLRYNVNLVGALERNSTTHNGHDIMSRATMMRATKGTLIFVSLPQDAEVYSNLKDRHTSFSGFLYEPVHGQQVAWSVYKNIQWSDDLFHHVRFEVTLLNEGGGWKSQGHYFRCPVAGVYYMTFTVGAMAGKRVHVNLVVNGQRVADIERSATNHNGVDVLSRSLVVELGADSLVYLEAEPNTAIFSNKERHTSFTGFLLYPK